MTGGKSGFGKLKGTRKIAEMWKLLTNTKPKVIIRSSTHQDEM